MICIMMVLNEMIMIGNIIIIINYYINTIINIKYFIGRNNYYYQ